MKRIGFLAVLAVLCVTCGLLYSSPIKKNLRFNGVATNSGDQEWFTIDSAIIGGDSFWVDTVYTDTFYLGDSVNWKWLHVFSKFLGYSLCDSCYDSMYVSYQLYGSYGNDLVKLLATDTFPTTNPGAAKPDSAASDSILTHQIRIDTFLVDRVWIVSRLHDSIGYMDTTDCSLRVQLRYELGAKE